MVTTTYCRSFYGGVVDDSIDEGSFFREQPSFL
jgi:hypothetical protein